jgi:peptide chain release factor subunit 1
MTGVDLDLVRELAEFRAARGRALSLYLDLDPSSAPTAADLDARISSLLTEARAQAEDVDSHEAKVGLGEDLTRIEDFFEQEFERDGARAIALFTDGPDGLWRVVALPDGVRDEARIGEELHVSPLAPLAGGQTDALVAVVGREQGLLLALRGGRLEPVAEQFDEQPGRHDQGGWAQARYQRHIEHLVQEHLRDVAARVEAELRGLGGGPLVLVGTEETVAEFSELLSVEAKAAVAGTAHAEAHATSDELLALVRPVLDEARAGRERELLDQWREAVGRDGRGAAGWVETLAAASDGKVATLLFAEGVTKEARRCPECGRVEAKLSHCPLDGAEMDELADGLEGALRQTLAYGGELVAIRHHQDLDPVEGIGALLRF